MEENPQKCSPLRSDSFANILLYGYEPGPHKPETPETTLTMRTKQASPRRVTHACFRADLRLAGPPTLSSILPMTSWHGVPCMTSSFLPVHAQPESLPSVEESPRRPLCPRAPFLRSLTGVCWFYLFSPLLFCVSASLTYRPSRFAHVSHSAHPLRELLPPGGQPGQVARRELHRGARQPHFCSESLLRHAGFRNRRPTPPPPSPACRQP